MSEVSEATKRAKFNIDFMVLRHVFTVISILLVTASIVSLAVRGINFGLDFTGGTSIEVDYAKAPNLSDVRDELSRAGFGDAVVQNFGTDRAVLVRLQSKYDEKLVDKVVSALKSGGQELELKRAEYVGAQVGNQLKEDGGLGMLLALAVVTIYVAMRFQFKFGIAAVVPLIHDVFVVLGFFSFFQWTFDLTVLAAILAVIGYSLNDTIIVADRIRENFRRMRKGGVTDIVNVSINQTLARTMNTSGTTLVVLLALFFFGGQMIHGFATALIIGVVVGTYSSIYVAANLLVYTGVSREDLIIPSKEGKTEADEKPPEWLNRM